MSTRAAIARPYGDGFRGRYHHFDGYPSGLGAALFRLRRDQFDGDTDRILRTLLDEHPAGWATIIGKDFAKAPGFHEWGEGLACRICGQDRWSHLCQTFGPEAHRDGPYPCGIDYSFHLGHQFEADPVEEAELESIPACYCHGSRAQDELTVDETNAAGMGVEYVYVLDGALMTILSSYDERGKMIGWFGAGNPDADWKIVAFVDLDGDEPNWDRLNERAAA